MSDTADGAQSPGAPSQHDGDIAPPSARPLSAGHPVGTDTAGISDEIAARLRRVMHSEVCGSELDAERLFTYGSIDWRHHSPHEVEAKYRFCTGKKILDNHLGHGSNILSD